MFGLNLGPTKTGPTKKLGRDLEFILLESCAIPNSVRPTVVVCLRY